MYLEKEAAQMADDRPVDMHTPPSKLREAALKRLQSIPQSASNSTLRDPQEVLQELEIHQIELELQNEELRSAQQELTLSRDRYQELYHQAPVGYVIADASGIILQANQTFGNMLSRDLASMLYKPLTQFIQTSDRTQFLSRYRSFFKKPAGKHLEIGLAKTDGTIIEAKLTARHMVSHGALSMDKTIAGQLLISINDITERKNAQRAIIRAKREWEQTFDAVPDLIVIIDDEGMIRRVNQAFADRMGLAPEACIGRHCNQALFSEISGPDVELFAKLMGSQTPVEVEAYNPKLDAYFIISASPFPETAGSGHWRILIFHDITTHRKAEKEALKVRNLESIGALAGGIAHDFNNILVSVVGFIELAQMFEGDEAAKFIDKALAATDRAKELTNRFLTFSHGGAPRTRPTAIRPLIERVLASSLDSTALKIDLRLAKNLHPIFADGLQIENVLQSVITNAREAMPRGGTLTIGARNIFIGERNGHPLKPGPHVAIQIRDEGNGIPAAHLEKVFDPYFTTKKMGAEKGMGLGLAIAYSVIRQHGGHVSIRSPRGAGTEVNVYLPAAFEIRPVVVDSSPQPMQLQPQPTSNLQASDRKRFRFLIMEDDTTLWDMLAQLFGSIDCHTDFAADGEAALRLYRQSLAKGTPYNGLFLDLTIRGGKGGKEVVQKILQINPAAKAVAFSGYTTDPVFSNHRKYGFVATLKKPFHLEELKQVTRQLIPGD
jgi:PAS domain S-box-containing protein